MENTTNLKENNKKDVDAYDPDKAIELASQLDSPLERTMCLIFGNVDKAKAEAKRYREKKIKQREKALEEASEILKENRIDINDIVDDIYVEVACNTFQRQIKNALDIELNCRCYKNKEDLVKAAKDILLSYKAYEYVLQDRKISDNFQITYVEKMNNNENNEHLNKVMQEAKRICQGYKNDIQVGKIPSYTYLLVYYATEAFYVNEKHTIDDACRVFAAFEMKNMIEQHYNPCKLIVEEKRLQELSKYNHYKQISEKYPGQMPAVIIDVNTPKEAKENRKVFDKAAKEIDNILNHTEECYGYHFNYINSGRKIYNVFKWKFEPDNTKADPTTDEGRTGTMWREDKGDFATFEEAKSVADADDEIEDYDPDEYWAIVDSKGNSPIEAVYAWKELAAVALINHLGEEKLPNWFAWNRMLDQVRG